MSGQSSKHLERELRVRMKALYVGGPRLAKAVGDALDDA